MTVREFHAHHRHDPGFKPWFEQAKLLSGLISDRPAAAARSARPAVAAARCRSAGDDRSSTPADGRALGPSGRRHHHQRQPFAPILRRPSSRRATSAIAGARCRRRDCDGSRGCVSCPVQSPANDDELPLSVILDENGHNGSSILAGREIGGRSKPVTLNKRRAEAARGGARRLGLRQDDAGAVHHRAAAAARHPRRADRPQGRSVQLRQSRRLARQRRRNSASGAASARSSPTPSTSRSTRPAARRAVRSRSRCCPTASTSCPSTSSSCWPTCRRRRSATCCI